MAKRVTDTEREAIIAAFDTGKSCKQIARDFGRSPSTISAIAKDAGHEFGRSNLARAQEAKAAYDDERRSRLRLRHVEAVERMLGQLFEPHLAFNFGGKDNTFESRELPEPPPRDKRDLTSAIRNLMTTVLEIDKREVQAEDSGLLDELFARIEDEAGQYSPEEPDTDHDPDGEAGVVD